MRVSSQEGLALFPYDDEEIQKQGDEYLEIKKELERYNSN